MKSKIYILLLLANLLALPTLKVNACGYYESEADYRAMMFRVMLPHMTNMRPFFYTMKDNYYINHVNDNISDLDTDPNQDDRYRNCREWLSQCDKTVLLSDIYKIQYETGGEVFVKAYNGNSWNEIFPENTFIGFLIRKENKELLDYMLFAKQMELTEIGSNNRFEEWGDTKGYYYHTDEIDYSHNKGKLFQQAQSRIDRVKSQFLKDRYAFQLCRLSYQLYHFERAIQTYDKYFKQIDPKNLMNIWACLFKAQSLDGLGLHVEANRSYCQVFANSNEKKFRCVQMYNREMPYNNTFSDKEKSIAITIAALRDPGRVVDSIRSAYQFDKTNPYIPFLVLREINKLEDWMITPLFYDKYSFYNDDPFKCAYSSPWMEKEPDEQADTLQAENLKTDMQYISQLKESIGIFSSNTTGDIKDFYTMGLAHLSLLQENSTEAKKYLSRISDKANPSIKLQMNLENIWMAIKTQDINSKSFQNTFTKNIIDLERVQSPRYDNHHMLYTLTLALANEYLKKDNIVYGNLMRMKADTYRGSSWWYYSPENTDSYYLMGYFDNNASVADMDKLIELINKKNKSSFEVYVCNQKLNSVDAYKDLKGTIAFRNNDLELAYKTFASMPQDYWQRIGLNYAMILNEDPFIPKGLGKNKDRSFDYKFNKTDFVKSLIDLQKEENADNYIKLGNAFFNVTYWGNSWMMTRYMWSSTTDLYYSEIDCLPQWMKNYMTASLAQDYYKKALKIAKNNEQKAYANLMLHYINRLDYNYVAKQYKDVYKHNAIAYGIDFNTYSQTNFYETYNCLSIENFLLVNQNL